MNTTLTNDSLKSTQAILRWTFILVPIIAGIDKFTNMLTVWENYLNPALVGILPVSGHVFMMIVGIIEIIAGILVFLKPRFGAFVVMAWLICIALNLITSGKYLDVAVRDLVMSIAALTLARLSK